jgi:hypothetical protein
LIDGILIPIANANKLLSSFIAKRSYRSVFLTFANEEMNLSAYSIVENDHRFFSYDSSIYRQFIREHLFDVQLLISDALIHGTFLFELHQANINVIDTVDEQTFAWLLRVYGCIPCNRLLLADDETLDKETLVLHDRHVLVNQQSYIYVSSTGK